MKDFRKLNVWQKSHQLVLEVYKNTRSFPKAEIYGLTNQLRRACILITSNISEGCGRGSDMDFARFAQMAMGSASEVEYQILLSHDLGYLETPIYNKLTLDVTEIKRMLTSLIKRLKADG
jgi:four helix bundle protein